MALILACVGVFFWQLSFSDSEEYSPDFPGVSERAAHTIEYGAMGRARFLLFYLLGGAAAVYAQSVIDPGSTVPTIGASGAVAAVLGAYLVLLPRARVVTLIFLFVFVTLIEIPAFVLLGVWFVLQFLPALGQATAPDVAGGGVAYFAHVGGFVFGLALIKLFARRVPAGLARA